MTNSFTAFIAVLMLAIVPRIVIKSLEEKFEHLEIIMGETSLIYRRPDCEDTTLKISEITRVRDFGMHGLLIATETDSITVPKGIEGYNDLKEELNKINNPN